jgi:hypothetical protein
MAAQRVSEAQPVKPHLPVSPVSQGTMPGREGQVASPREGDDQDGPTQLGSPYLDDSAEGQAADGVDGPQDASPTSDGPARKRRRSRKGLDKRFECSEEGCGKSYSRAEHLYEIRNCF